MKSKLLLQQFTSLNLHSEKSVACKLLLKNREFSKKLNVNSDLVKAELENVVFFYCTVPVLAFRKRYVFECAVFKKAINKVTASKINVFKVGV